MKYVLYNPDTGQFLGNRESSLDGKHKDIHQFFNDEEIDFLLATIKDAAIPECKDDWVDNWQRMHNIYLELRGDMWNWWAMIYDEEERCIVHTSSRNFCLEKKPEGVG